MEKKILPILIIITLLLLFGGYLYNRKYLRGPDIDTEIEATLEQTSPSDFDFEE